MKVKKFYKLLSYFAKTIFLGSKGLNLTSGSVGKKLSIIVLPLVFSFLLTTLYGIIDAIWLGHYSGSSIAAVQMSIDVIGLLNALVFGISSGAALIISKSIGAREKENSNKVAAQVLLLVNIFAVFVIAVVVPNSGGILNLLNTPSAVFNDAKIYMIIYLLCSPIVYTLFSSGAIIDGCGNTMTSLMFSFASIVLNIILDPVFIFGLGPIPEYGVAGAAIASMLSMTIVTAFVIFAFKYGTFGIKLKRSHFLPNKKVLKDIFEKGLPFALSLGSTYLSLIIMVKIVASVSNHYYAGTPTVINVYAIVMRTMMVFIFIAFAFQKAVSIFVAQNAGAGKLKRAIKGVNYGAYSALVISFTGFIMFFFFGSNIASLFVTKNMALGAETIAMSIDAFKIISPGIMMLSVAFVVMGAFHGASHLKPILVIEILRSWIFMIVPADLLSFYFGLKEYGIWWSLFLSCNTGVLAIIWYFRGSWKRNFKA